MAVTGTAAAFLSYSHGDFERTRNAYATLLEKKTISLCDEDMMDGTSLNAGILLSLDYIVAEIMKWKVKRSLKIEYSISDLFNSLSVFKSQVAFLQRFLGGCGILTKIIVQMLGTFPRA